MGRVFFNTRKNVKEISAAYDVLASDSGTVFMINQASAYAITLPSTATALDGFHCEFIVGTVGGYENTITCTGTDLFHGFDTAQEGGDVTWGVTEGTGIYVITLISGVTKGDRVQIECDGTSYYFITWAADAAHITIAAE